MTNNKNEQKCTIDDDTFYTFPKNTWIADTGAPCYTSNNAYDMSNVKMITKLCRDFR